MNLIARKLFYTFMITHSHREVNYAGYRLYFSYLVQRSVFVFLQSCQKDGENLKSNLKLKLKSKNLSFEIKNLQSLFVNQKPSSIIQYSLFDIGY